MTLYIGLMSGTSADGIDAALVDFAQRQPQLLATHYTPYPAEIRQEILSLTHSGHHEIDRLGELDILLAKAFANATNCLLAKAAVDPTAIKAIGSHGQTIRHRPHLPNRFTLQIGDPNTIAALTGITTIADFRRKDIAFGGQGAPLVPAFHREIFANNLHDQAIVNIGGIANTTLLFNTKDKTVGFDTGPGNALLDAWILESLQKNADYNGEWAASGQVSTSLLNMLLNDEYFTLAPPKSTGREYFHLSWLTNYLNQINLTLSPQDIQATLTELTAQTIIDAIRSHFKTGEILVCGGGTHNGFLMGRLKALAEPDFTVDTTEKYGIHPDWVEAAAFAWLAKQTLNHQPGNLPSVTGATASVILGGIYMAN